MTQIGHFPYYSKSFKRDKNPKRMLFQLLRVRQWYKNTLIFLPLVFAGLITDISSVVLSVIGFVALCLMSSTNYIVNDIVDRDKDKIHPEKCQRPIAAGKISISAATTIAMVCATLALILAFVLAQQFFVILLIFFGLTQVYSLFLKNEVFLDIIAISTNFVLRAVSGVFLLDVRLSPWLIICPFFLGLFIASGKRYADISLLKEKSHEHKKVLAQYSPEIARTLIILSTALLILSYSLYSFLSVYPHLIYTIPIALYLILRYYYLIESHSPIARHPEHCYKDKRLVAGIIAWTIAVFILIY